MKDGEILEILNLTKNQFLNICCTYRCRIKTREIKEKEEEHQAQVIRGYALYFRMIEISLVNRKHNSSLEQFICLLDHSIKVYEKAQLPFKRILIVISHPNFHIYCTVRQQRSFRIR